MRADNTHHLIAAARQRSRAARRRATAALRRMDTTGTPVTFDAVAQQANVSRSWLYTQPDLRAEIEHRRSRQRPATQRLIPDRQRASDASLQRRLELAAERIHHLDADNKRLREALAEALGERRAATSLRRRRDTPTDEPHRRPNPA